MAADIVDPQVVAWANNRARRISDQFTALYYDILAYQTDYAAQSIAAKITAAGGSGNIIDGSSVDGRSTITGTSLTNLIAAINQMKTQLEAAVTGVGVSTAAITAGIQVNGSPR